jgi:serine/threonine protein kinase
MSANPPLPFSLGSVITDTQKGLNLRLIEALGSGSYAIVYKAQALHDGQLYALKCISKMDISNEDLEVQKQEIEIHRSLVKSSRIARLVSHFETEQYLFLILEYIQGMDLYWWILHKNDHYDSATGRKLDTLERLTVLSNLFVQCLDAVHFIHTKKIAHRDLKPEVSLVLVVYDINVLPHADYYFRIS